MAVQIVISPQVWLLVSLLIENAIRGIMDSVGKMTPAEIDAGIIVEEGKKRVLMAEIDSH
jgi:hypothetical protein